MHGIVQFLTLPPSQVSKTPSRYSSLHPQMLESCENYHNHPVSYKTSRLVPGISPNEIIRHYISHFFTKNDSLSSSSSSHSASSSEVTWHPHFMFNMGITLYMYYFLTLLSRFLDFLFCRLGLGVSLSLTQYYLQWLYFSLSHWPTIVVIC